MVNDGRLELTPLRVEDAVDMVDVLFSPALYEYTGGEPPALDALRRQYAAQAEGGPADGSEQWLNWIVRQQGEPIGYVQATLSDGSDDAEIAWVIGLPWQGRGLAKAAAALLVRELASRGVQGIRAHIHPRHEASKRIAASLGMHSTDTIVDGEIRWEGTASAEA
ncbi:GNAT family N-acetyltransferase [Agrococcus casei]|uniref:Putative acetyltransferase n=1 Tax=Agrococcus casei LMG 22410 TaxID=1255656 RepID=A0A1R4EZN9_9MICO|nr:GNAT family N-acetyltransferase [Agrococcus casei]SJM49023.1 putative acetyltransferase [Agrococcus casei LMG 22410]